MEEISRAMVRQESVERTVRVPENVTVRLEGRRVSVNGPLGTLEEDLSHLPVTLARKDDGIVITTIWPRKRELGLLGTAAAHIRNILIGVTDGYILEIKLVYAIFDIVITS